MLWSAATGLVLVHADDLGLDHRPVRTAWVLDLWGVPVPEVEVGYRTPLGWIASDGDRAYLDAAPLPPQLGALGGVATFADAGGVNDDMAGGSLLR